MPQLDVYISDGCWNCGESRRIAAEMRFQFPSVRIQVHDLETSEPPTTVFAVPTYVLDGKVLFMGNPSRDELKGYLRRAQVTQG